MTTESCVLTGNPATMQIWTTTRGTGSRLFRCTLKDISLLISKQSNVTNFSMKSIQFFRAITQVSLGGKQNYLFFGASNGDIFAMQNLHGKANFELTMVISDFTSPIMALAGDRRESNYLVGSDESGKLIAWSIETKDEKDNDSEWRLNSRIIYEYLAQEDMICSLRIRGNLVFAGHVSGCLTVHEVERQKVLVSSMTNTKSITSIDLYPDKNLLLVCGEDCRVTVLGFSHSRCFRPVVHFSVILDSIVVGCALEKSSKGYPRILALPWEGRKIVQYEYERSCRRGRNAGAVKCAVETSPRDITVMSSRQSSPPRVHENKDIDTGMCSSVERGPLDAPSQVLPSAVQDLQRVRATDS